MYLLCLFGSSSLTCTDSPNRLISQNNLGEVFSRQREYRCHLSGNNLILLVRLAFFQHFTDTEDRSQAVCQSQFYFFFKNSNCFTIICTTFRVPQNHIFGTGRSNHGGRNFTCVCAGFFVRTVFSTHSRSEARRVGKECRSRW